MVIKNVWLERGKETCAHKNVGLTKRTEEDEQKECQFFGICNRLLAIIIHSEQRRAHTTKNTSNFKYWLNCVWVGGKNANSLNLI